MDSDVKKQIKNLVLNLRKLFEDDLAVVLKRYGIFTDRAWLPVDKIPKADDEVLHTRQRLEAAMQPNLERGVKRPEAARLYMREAGFTYLNRLVGLKVLEVRSLFPETIQTRPEYSGRSLYQRDFRAAHPELANAADDALPAALEAACRDVSQQIRFVFDVESESSILWPRYAALKEAIQRINALSLEVWQEDEIIGWIYQFYNAEEKKAIRKRGKPKLPIEVAVINQFFTPRWIVKYLVDNTLGRLWLEMHPDSQGVRAKCDYLVPEPLGVPEDGGEEGKIQLDPDSPVNNPDGAPRREPKRPQDIRLIDPACGTMHFGHYAFEVFQEIYRDAREQGWVDAEDALEDRDIPLSILKHNLYGVDIDLRAVQLAALSLYVKARTSQRSAGMADREAARLPWSVNLVCADARLTNGGMRERFLSAYADDPVLVRAWKELFREMEDIGQVGSLLRVEERFRQILREYKPPTVAGLGQPHQESLPGVPTPPRQMGFGETPSSNGWSPRRTLSKMLIELGDFAKKALDEHDINAQVFAAEAVKTISLLDVLMAQYDIAVMNPPYGYTTPEAEKLLSNYQLPSYDLYAVFIAQTLGIVRHGYLGAFVSRTFMFLPTFEEFRRRTLLTKTHILTLAETDLGTLDDATVRPSAVVLDAQNSANTVPGIFYKLSHIEADKRQIELEKLLSITWGITSDKSSRPYILNPTDFSQLPKAIFAYTIPPFLINLIKRFMPLDRDLANRNQATKISDVKVGLSTGADDIFRRYWWEVNQDKIGSKWKFFVSGGGFSRYYTNPETVIDWENDGYRLKNFKGSAIRNKKFYFRSGISLPYISEKGVGACFMESGCIFGHASRVVFPKSNDITWELIAILNSELMDYLIKAYTPDRKHEASFIAALPIKIPENQSAIGLRNNALLCHSLKSNWDLGSETNYKFEKPWILQVIDSDLRIEINKIWIAREQVNLPFELFAGLLPTGDKNPFSLTDILEFLTMVEAKIDALLIDIQSEIDKKVYQLYEIGDEIQQQIKRESVNRTLDVLWPATSNLSRLEKRREHVRSLISYFIIKSINNVPDGIIPLIIIPGKKSALNWIQSCLESEFGERRAYQFEQEITKELGEPLEYWLNYTYTQWHNKLHQSCPIVWHLASQKGNFACLVYYHKLKRDTLLNIRTVYLWRLRDSLRSRLKTASEKKDYTEISELEEALADIEEFDQALAKVIESGLDPDIDAGVKANILPLQEAGLLRYKVI